MQCIKKTVAHVKRVYFSYAIHKLCCCLSLAICSRIINLPNGNVFGKTYLDGDQLRFQCLQGYVLDGKQSITCLSNRTWSARKPLCRGKQIIASSYTLLTTDNITACKEQKVCHESCSVFCDLLQYTHTGKCNPFVLYSETFNLLKILRDFCGMEKNKKTNKSTDVICRHLHS